MRTDHNKQKKIALVNDLTGFGRCSVAVQLPVISHMGVQCCVLPTSILSNHTQYDSFSFQDHTAYMEDHISEWRKLGLTFRGICTGFLGSEEQIDIVKRFISEFALQGTVVVIDPVMGDYGRPYVTYTPSMCERMRELVGLADILTPNLTEACLLARREFEPMDGEDAMELARELSGFGPSRVVITGVEAEDEVINACFDAETGPFCVESNRLGEQRSGTGDVFSAIIAADAVNDVPFDESVKKASDFVEKCVRASIAMDVPLLDGLCFEEVLYELR